MIEIVIPRETLIHLEDQLDETDSLNETIGVSLDPSHAKNLFDALILGLGAISPQPSELAGKAIDDMERSGDTAALTGVADEAIKRLNNLGIIYLPKERT